MESASVHLERADGVAVLTLDRPPLNIMDTAMLRALAEALAEVAADSRVKALLLEANGRAFCAGVDVADHGEDRVRPMMGAFRDVVRRLLALDVPAIAAVRGAALGGGCELLLACDLVLASDTAKLGLPEIRLGVFPPVATALLPSRIGPQAAADLVLTGRTVDAEEACRLGLVARVVPATELEAQARSIAAGHAALSGPVLRLAKRALTAVRGMSPDAALDWTDSLYLDELLQLHDAHEGIAAFIEKRAPVWQEA